MDNTQKNEKYFPFHYKLFSIFGLGQFYNSTENEYSKFSNSLYTIYSIFQHIFWTLFFPIALWLEVPNLLGDLDRLMLNLTFSITFTLMFVKLAIILAQRKNIQKLLHVLEVELVTFTQSESIMNKSVKISKHMTLAVLMFANTTVIGLIIGGVYQAFWYPGNASGVPEDRILPMPVYLPYEVSSNFLYSITFVYQIFGVVWCGNLVVLINTLMNAIMVHAAGRFANLRFVLENIKYVCLLKLLSKNSNIIEDAIMDSKLNIDKYRFYKKDQNEYEKMEKDVLKKYGQDTLDAYLCKSLKECILHHRSIITCVDVFQRIYSLGFLAHIITNLNIICHVMIQISENEVLSFRFCTATALFFTVVSEFLVQNYAGNELTLQAMGIAESAYGCHWYTSSRKFKRMLLILMIRAQKPIEVTAGKFFTLSNATFVNIMKGAYSFFAVIRSTKRSVD